ncbi:MAG: sugar phosphate isomerase/epimerase [Clostridia bacterium]|nr:sugar phosphate isomerase/epimerase [Clostridia bacterium]
MLLVTQTDRLAELYGDRRAIAMLAEAGFDGIDFSMFHLTNGSHPLLEDDWRREAEALRAYADSIGIPFVQGHAPFSFRDNTPEGWRTNNYPRLVRAIEIAGVLGIRELVIHPVQFLPYKQNVETLHAYNMEFYRALIPHAKAAGVRICLENMWQRNRLRGNLITHSTCSRAEEAAAWVDELGDSAIGYCLDLGHCGLVELDAGSEIRKLGRRITALHVHDNDFMEDQHILPYQGHADWADILSALREVGYAGAFTFEADNFLRQVPEAVLPTALKLMVEVGRYMIGQIEG